MCWTYYHYRMHHVTITEFKKPFIHILTTKPIQYGITVSYSLFGHIVYTVAVSK